MMLGSYFIWVILFGSCICKRSCSPIFTIAKAKQHEVSCTILFKINVFLAMLTKDKESTNPPDVSELKLDLWKTTDNATQPEVMGEKAG